MRIVYTSWPTRDENPTEIQWNDSSAEESVRRGHAVPVASLAVAADGRFALTGTSEALVKLWPLR